MFYVSAVHTPSFKLKNTVMFGKTSKLKIYSSISWAIHQPFELQI